MPQGLACTWVLCIDMMSGIVAVLVRILTRFAMAFQGGALHLRI